MARSVDDNKLDKLVQYFEEFDLEMYEGRRESERCRDYHDHKQWTEEEARVLRARKQPVITVNRIKPKVDFMLGLERQQRTDPKAFPRTPVHEKAAESVTDAIRFVCDNNRWDGIRSEGFEHLLIEGTAAVNVFAEYRNERVEVALKLIPWDRFFHDSKSRQKDFSDSKVMGEFLWMDEEDALTKWPDKEDVIEGAYTTSESHDDTFEDTPRNQWSDKTRKRIRVCQAYYKEQGTWMYAVYTSSGFLEDPIISPYLDEYGQPECAIKARSLFVDREGVRYGFVKQYLDIQDEINHRRSKALHLLNNRQTFSRKGVVKDVDEFKREMAKPDGHVEVLDGIYGQDFGKFETGDMTQGQFMLLEEAKGEIDAVGVNAAMSGQEERNMSGRALLARQHGGQMEVGPILDGLRMWSNEVYRSIWYRIKQFWQEPRWVRVTDNEQAPQWVGINRPITARERLEQQGPIPPAYQMDPRLNQIVEVENNVAELDVDIIIDDAPDSVTIQAEQFEQLVQMYQANPQAIPFDLIIQASSLRNKDQLLEMAKQNSEQQGQMAQMQQQFAQMMQQLEAQNKEADTHKKHASAIRDEAEAQKTMAETGKTVVETQQQTMFPRQNMM